MHGRRSYDPNHDPNDDQDHDHDHNHNDHHDKYAQIWSDLRSAQGSVHRWGGANQVIFDPNKESFHILHRREGEGDNFKILGVIFDAALRMHAAVRHVATEAGWRLQTLMRARSFFSTPELVHLSGIFDRSSRVPHLKLITQQILCLTQSIVYRNAFCDISA